MSAVLDKEFDDINKEVYAHLKEFHDLPENTGSITITIFFGHFLCDIMG